MCQLLVRRRSVNPTDAELALACSKNIPMIVLGGWAFYCGRGTPVVHSRSLIYVPIFLLLPSKQSVRLIATLYWQLPARVSIELFSPKKESGSNSTGEMTWMQIPRAEMTWMKHGLWVCRREILAEERPSPGQVLCNRIHLLIGFRKSTPPQNRQLVVYHC